jgi:negative regulator of flagellin synthesis FlgM
VTNRINGYDNSRSIASSKGTANSTPTADKVQSDSTTAPAASTADQVTLTGSARTLQKLSEAVASAPVVDTAKVAQIKEALQNGTYQINTQSVADKLLQSESGLS